MDIPNSMLGNLEKPMKLRWCLVFITSMSFLELYLLLKFNINFSKLSVEWFKAELDSYESILLVLTFTFIFSAVIPGINRIVKYLALPMLIWIVKEKFVQYFPKVINERHVEEFDYDNYISIDVLKRLGIKDNNFSAYSAAVAEENSIKEIMFYRFLCQTTFILPLLGWFASSEEAKSMLVVFYEWSESLNDYMQAAVLGPIALFAGYLFIVGFQKLSKDIERGYMYFPNHGYDPLEAYKKSRQLEGLDDE